MCKRGINSEVQCSMPTIKKGDTAPIECMNSRNQASINPRERKSNIEGKSLFYTDTYFQKGPWINCREFVKNSVKTQTKKIKVPTIATKATQDNMRNNPEYLVKKDNLNNQEEKIKRKNKKSAKITIVKENGEEIFRKVDLKKSITKKGIRQPKIIKVFNSKNEILFEVDREARKKIREEEERLRQLRIQENKEKEELERMRKEKEEILKKIRENNARLIKERKESGFYKEKKERIEEYKKIQGLVIRKRKEIQELEQKFKFK